MKIGIMYAAQPRQLEQTARTLGEPLRKRASG